MWRSYSLQIANIINAGYRSIGEIPVVIGETGVPFDLNGGQAFKTGDFSWQERQMDAICSALETNLVSYKSVLVSQSLMLAGNLIEWGSQSLDL